MSRHLLVKSRALLVALHFHTPVTGIPMIRCAGCLLALAGSSRVAAPASNTLSHSVGTELVLPLVRCPSGCAGIRIRNTPRGPASSRGALAGVRAVTGDGDQWSPDLARGDDAVTEW